jgi:hypothetical protein
MPRSISDRVGMGDLMAPDTVVRSWTGGFGVPGRPVGDDRPRGAGTAYGSWSAGSLWSGCAGVVAATQVAVRVGRCRGRRSGGVGAVWVGGGDGAGRRGTLGAGGSALVLILLRLVGGPGQGYPRTCRSPAWTRFSAPTTPTPSEDSESAFAQAVAAGQTPSPTRVTPGATHSRPARRELHRPVRRSPSPWRVR